MANTKLSYLENKKVFFNNQKIKMKKEIARLSKLLNLTDPDSPQYAKYAAQKEELTIKLYGTESDYDKLINKLTKDVEDLRGNIEKKDKDRTLSEKLKEDISRKIEPLTRKVDAIQDSYTYRFAKSGLKATGKLGMATGKLLLKTLLTKKVNQKKFLGIKYGGQRVGRFKFNDGLLKKYSKDYEDLGRNFYLMGKGLYNRDIKKGALDAGDIITYMREQGESNEEILKSLQKFSQYGLTISDSYINLLQDTKEDVDKDGLTGYDDVNNRNQAILINEENKENLKETLLDFYDYIEKSKPKPKKENPFVKMLSNIVKGAWNASKWLLGGLLAFGATPLGAIILAAISAIVYFWGDEVLVYAKALVNKFWKWAFGKDFFDLSEGEKVRQASLSRCYKDIDKMEMPNDKDFDTLDKDTKILFDANGNKIDEETRAAIEKYAKEQGISEAALAGIIQTESNFNPNAVSGVGAKGLMQFMPATWRDEGHGNIFDPTENVKAGAQYYKKLLNRYHGDERKALAAYNWGMGNVDKAVRTYGEDAWIYAAPLETQNYIKRNFANRNAIIQANSPLAKATMEDPTLNISGDINADINDSLGISEDTTDNFYTPMSEPSFSNPNIDIKSNTNSNIIKEEENRQSSLVKKPEIASKPVTKKNNTTSANPISIPYHLGGGDLNLLNFSMR